MANDWFKMHSRGWLTGSIRAQLTSAERGVWGDLLAMANESRIPGTICRASGIPYTREYIAAYLEIDIELLNSTVAKCIKDENADDPCTRIALDEYGCLIISNWRKYQARPDKSIAKEVAIEKTRDTKRRQATAVDKLIQAVNRQNQILRERRYEVIDGKTVDTRTGEVTELDDKGVKGQ